MDHGKDHPLCTSICARSVDLLTLGGLRGLLVDRAVPGPEFDRAAAGREAREAAFLLVASNVTVKVDLRKQPYCNIGRLCVLVRG